MSHVFSLLLLVFFVCYPFIQIVQAVVPQLFFFMDIHNSSRTQNYLIKEEELLLILLFFVPTRRTFSEKGKKLTTLTFLSLMEELKKLLG